MGVQMKTAGTIKWLVDFSQTDLRTISPGDRAKLIIEAVEILCPSDAELDFYTKGDRYNPNCDWVRLIPEKESPAFWDLIIQLQPTVLLALSTVLGLTGIPATNVTPRGGWYLFHVEGEEIHFDFVPLVGDVHEYNVFRIYRLFDRVPKNSLVLCPSCNRLFFNPTRKAKKYCSNKCLYRIHSQKYRENNPEKYRKSQRDLMSKKYEAARKEKYGPKVKINHRVKKEG
jgi:hypothetical protein